MSIYFEARLLMRTHIWTYRMETNRIYTRNSDLLNGLLNLV